MASSKQERGWTLYIWLSGAVIISLLALGLATFSWSSRRKTEEEWASRLAAQATMLAAHARQSIGAANLVLRSLSDEATNLGVSNQEQFRSAFSTRKAYDALRDAMKGVPQIDVTTIVALNGDIINFSRSYPPPPINLADRDYFQAHLKDPALDIYVSAPVQNRGDGGWTFYLARKIRSPSGEMVGLVLTGLFSDFFSTFYESVSSGPLNGLSLYRNNGVLISRYPVVRSALGRSFAESATFSEALGGNGGVKTTRTARTTDPTNHDLRMIAARRDADFPIVVAANATGELYLADWREETQIIFVAGVLISLLMGLVTWALVRLVRQLEIARAHALQAVAAKSRFVSTVSHEIRTPLTAVITGASQLLDQNLVGPPRKIAMLVSQSAQHLLQLINDILDFSVLESENPRIEMGSFNVRELLHNAFDIVKYLPQAKSLDMRLQIDPSLPHSLYSDKRRLTQILINLLGNAVKYTPAGSITLDAKYFDGMLYIAVSDTGRGIAQEDQARIFMPFERISEVVGKVSGTGLGLTICKRLADLLGGRISLESTPGQGSRFLVAVPMPPAVPEVLNVDRAAGEEKNRLRILIAEDVAANRMLMTLELKRHGHEVAAVSNGREAVELAAKFAPDCILMDVQMPEMDGLEATRRIRLLDQPVASVPIVAITAYSETDTEKEIREAGMNYILNKPFDVAKLRTVFGAIKAKPAQTTTISIAAAPEIYVRFIEDIDEGMNRLEAGLRNSDTVEIRRAAHSLKGSFAMFCYPELGALAGAIASGEADAPAVSAFLARSAALVKNLRPLATRNPIAA